MGDWNKPIAECDPSDHLHTDHANRQYYCPHCETLVVIRGDTRYCKCFKDKTEDWEEVFLD